MRKILLLLIPFILISCAKKEKIYVSAFVLRSVGTPWLYPDYYKEAYLYKSEGFSQIPVVKINDTVLPIYDYSSNWYQFIEFRKLEIDREYRLNVSSPEGNVFGKVYMPGPYEILFPESTYILNKDSSLKVIWRTANKAQWYWLDLTIEYDYEDTLGEWDTYELWMDTILFDTFCFYEKDRFIPSYVATIFEGEGIINIWAMDGPPILPGSQGNITGSGYGFFHAAFQPGERGFFVGSPPKERKLKSKGKEKLKRLFSFQRNGIYR
jgi:hypothetical protein|uniref:DUF4249 family protein n=1 Tax=candidate division WOR-3 bacterium TaxID=2052148 RepID=A0A7C3Z2P4_UNCW3